MLHEMLKANLLLIPIVVIAVGLLPIGGDYYTLVRIVVFIFGLVAFLGLPQDYGKEKIIFLIIAVVYNPIFPVYFGSRLIWFPINIITIWFFYKLRNELKEYDL